jgi:hypothetical protein
MSETFRFGNVSGPVNAGSGNLNVGSGSQYVAGGDVSVGNSLGADPTASAALEALRQELAGLRLTNAERETAAGQLEAVATATDKGEAAQHLGSFVSGLKQAGALASAGSSFAASIAKLATWIGPLAAGVVALL